MGATKRVAELMTIDASQRSAKPIFRGAFGNVLGSRGSVVPAFHTPDAKASVTVTHRI
jgi:FlaA1/EpsC-like NDP-sugar epimerase